MASSEFHPSSPTWNLLVPAGYMVVAGIAGFVLPLFRLVRDQPEFQEQSLAFRAGGRTRELILSTASIVAGTALFWHHSWARTLALGVLLIETVYGPNSFAWGLSGRQPTRRVRLLAHVLVACWNGFWFYLICRLAL
jgi:hypothetical protein